LNESFDVLGLGAVAVDELIYVDAFPPPDAKTRVSRTERACGGLTATALVAASRLGSSCAYAGILGTDELSDFAVRCLQEEKVDLTHLQRRPEVKPVHSFIVVGEQRHTRNVFANSKDFTGPAENWPPEQIIQRSKVLLIDHFGLPGMIRAARIARAAGVAVVADAERDSGPRFAEWLECADHLILGARFAAQLTSASSPEDAVQRLWSPQRQVVVVTDGHEGCWSIDKGDPVVRHQPAFRAHAVDTTGCGDVFHGAYASALARGLPVLARIRIASMAAALKSRFPGGQAGIPTRDEVEDVLDEFPATY